MSRIVKTTLILLVSAAPLAAGIFYYVTTATVQPRQAFIARHLSASVLRIRPDAEETAETDLKKVLDGNGANKGRGKGPMIDKRGIEVVFFGLSQTVGERETSDGQRRHFTRARDSRRADFLRDGWLS